MPTCLPREGIFGREEKVDNMHVTRVDFLLSFFRCVIRVRARDGKHEACPGAVGM